MPQARRHASAGQLALVEQPDGEIGRGIRRVPRLPRIVGIVAEPADESRPPGQLRQVPCQVLLPARLGNAEAAEQQRDRVLRPLGQGPYLSIELFDAEEDGRRSPAAPACATRRYRPRSRDGIAQPAMPSSTNAATHLVVCSLTGSTTGSPVNCSTQSPTVRSNGKIDRRGGRLVAAAGARQRATRARPQFPQIGRSTARRIGPCPRALLHRIRKVVLQLVQRAAGAERPVQQQRFERREAVEQVAAPHFGWVDQAVPNPHDVEPGRAGPTRRSARVTLTSAIRPVRWNWRYSPTDR